MATHANALVIMAKAPVDTAEDLRLLESKRAASVDTQPRTFELLKKQEPRLHGPDRNPLQHEILPFAQGRLCSGATSMVFRAR